MNGQAQSTPTSAQHQAAPADSSYRDKNEVHLCGALARDPEVRQTPTGKTVANLSLLTVNKQYKSYHSLVAWEQLAEKASSLKKGERIKCVGALQTRSWERDGQKHYRTEIVCWQIVIQGKEGAFKNAHGVTIDDSDIPF